MSSVFMSSVFQVRWLDRVGDTNCDAHGQMQGWMKACTPDGRSVVADEERRSFGCLSLVRFSPLSKPFRDDEFECPSNVITAWCGHNAHASAQRSSQGRSFRMRTFMRLHHRPDGPRKSVPFPTTTTVTQTLSFRPTLSFVGSREMHDAHTFASSTHPSIRHRMHPQQRPPARTPQRRPSRRTREADSSVNISIA